MTSGKTILLIGNHFNSGGLNVNTWNDFPTHISNFGWKVIKTSNYRNRIIRLIDMLVTIFIRRKEYQVAEIDVYSGKAFLWADLCSRLLRKIRKPFVLTLHGGNLPQFAKRNKNRISKLLNRAHIIVSPSKFLIEQFKTIRQDIIIINNPIDLSLYKYRHTAIPMPHLLWVRAFHEIYNPQIVPEMIHYLATKWADIQITMIGPDKGDGSLNRMLEKAKEKNVVDRIILTGGVPKEKIPYYLGLGDIFINTTNIDNTPVSVIEAMACGLCVVSTNVGGIPYLVRDGIEGILVPPDDSVAIAKAVERILTEPGLAETLSANARLKAEEFDWDLVVPQWNKVFSDLLIDG